MITEDWRYDAGGGETVRNREDYGEYIVSSLTAENVFAYAEVSAAQDGVVRCAQEEAYIAYVAGLV